MDPPLYVAAQALLKPRHGDADVAFDPNARSGPSSLKAMRPDPARVKAAVAEFKRLGFRVTFVGTFALSIGAMKGRYEEVFGVRLERPDETDDAARTTGVVIRDGRGERLDVVPVAANGVLHDAISEILLPGRTVLHDGATPPAKTKPWHLYPNEFRAALAPPRSPPESTEVSAIHGKGVVIGILDSGFDSEHPYLKDHYAGQIKHISPATVSTILRAPQNQAERIAGLDRRLAECRRRLDELGKRRRGQSDSPVREIVEVYRDLLALVAESEQYTSLDPKQKITTKNFFDTLRATLAQLDPSSDADSQVVLALFDSVRGHLVTWKGSLAPLWHRAATDSRALKAFMTRADDTGHGTGMAASALGVAPAADVDVWKGLVPNEVSRAKLGDANETRLRSFTETTFGQIASGDKAGRTIRIFSNSYGEFSDAMSAHYRKRVEQWRKLVKQAVAVHRLVVVFSAGNANYDATGAPVKNLRAAQAATGPAGAIVVGGAYTTSAPQPIRTGATPVAHGYRISSEHTVPDVCGLVGPVLLDGSAQLVYLPSSGGKWNTAGGGTSSAAAQIAGLCACILEAWPNAGPGDVKAIVTTTAAPATLGETWQGETPDDLEGLRLADAGSAITHALASRAVNRLLIWKGEKTRAT